MTFSEINEIYFDWICRIACLDDDIRSRYSLLLDKLYSVEFEYIIPLDKNRYSDGISLRYAFGNEIGLNEDIIDSLMNEKPCSILEMMVALSLKCEEIMSSKIYYYETSIYFMDMIRNLGLADSTDDNFDKDWADQCIDRFLNRRYDYYGTGGLFTVSNPRQDMTKTEIWYQMNWYLAELLGENLL